MTTCACGQPGHGTGSCKGCDGLMCEPCCRRLHGLPPRSAANPWPDKVRPLPTEALVKLLEWFDGQAHFADFAAAVRTELLGRKP